MPTTPPSASAGHLLALFTTCLLSTPCSLLLASVHHGGDATPSIPTCAVAHPFSMSLPSRLPLLRDHLEESISIVHHFYRLKKHNFHAAVDLDSQSSLLGLTHAVRDVAFGRE
jgi:hypothetical protein